LFNRAASALMALLMASHSFSRSSLHPQPAARQSKEKASITSQRFIARNYRGGPGSGASIVLGSCRLAGVNPLEAQRRALAQRTAKGAAAKAATKEPPADEPDAAVDDLVVWVRRSAARCHMTIITF
jgi:hypothetical protein